MVTTEIRLIIFFAAKDGEVPYSQQKQDRELTGSDHELLIEVFLPGESQGRGSLMGCSLWILYNRKGFDLGHTWMV